MRPLRVTRTHTTPDETPSPADISEELFTDLCRRYCQRVEKKRKKEKKRGRPFVWVMTRLEINYKTGVASARKGAEGILKISMSLGVAR